MNTIRSYRDLRVWQRAVDFTVQIYAVTRNFPRAETFGISGQMRRASVSIASNIAEGFGRSGKEYGRYLQMALGSVAEVETQIEIAYRTEFISDEDYTELTGELTIVGKQLSALRQSVLKKSR